MWRTMVRVGKCAECGVLIELCVVYGGFGVGLAIRDDDIFFGGAIARWRINRVRCAHCPELR